MCGCRGNSTEVLSEIEHVGKVWVEKNMSHIRNKLGAARTLRVAMHCDQNRRRTTCGDEKREAYRQHQCSAKLEYM